VNDLEDGIDPEEVVGEYRPAVSVRVLRDYNPAILHDRVPPGPSYELRLPLQESADARDPAAALIF